MEVDSSDDDIEVMSFQFFFDSEDSVKRVWLFGIGDSKRQGEEFDFGFLDAFREASGGAIDADLDLSAEGQAFGVLQFIEDSSSDIFDKAFEFDGLTLLAEIGVALVVGVGGKEGAIGGEDSEGEKAQEADDLDENLSYTGIEFFT